MTALRKLTLYICIALLPFILCKKGSNGTDPNDEISSWVKTYGNNNSFCAELLQANDGGFFLVGGTDIAYDPVRQGDAYLIKTDEDGDSLWSRTFGGENGDFCSSIIQTADGGFALAGRTDSFGAGEQICGW